jgi:hypothetical protein
MIMKKSIVVLMTMLSGAASSSHAAPPNQNQVLTVPQLLANEDRYSKENFIVRGYLELDKLKTAFSRVGILVKDKKTIERYHIDIHRDTPAEEEELQKILDTNCIDIWDLTLLYRDKKFINHRYVTLRAKLVDDGGEVLKTCSGQIDLLIEEVLDPALPPGPSRESAPGH